MPKEETKKTNKWVAQLQVVSDREPPVKIIANIETEEVLTLESAMAKLLNDVDELKDGLL